MHKQEAGCESRIAPKKDRVPKVQFRCVLWKITDEEEEIPGDPSQGKLRIMDEEIAPRE